jgi:hypothetical protein
LVLMEDLAAHGPGAGQLGARRAELDAVFERLGPRLLHPRHVIEHEA